MELLNSEQQQEVSGGIFINPVTVMLAVRLVTYASPYVLSAAAATATAVGSAVGGYLASDGGE
ncbi:hypothetical protein [Umboniibacter marinipuniceus]|uniref:Uncharacterized protein n=1 Tax=Umboniibacter marinipuniceus TaxID=569599 RepID=A0A3M0A6L4_9GAMM|nr:hypothetical protein [Umboniibacter marinipuniceus]RMA80237.1 hypothetical protein DFR27_1601 [Umboniibacter marinipuniceus]